MDISGAALIRPFQIHHYVFGEGQDTLEVQDCLEGIFRLLQLEPFTSLLQQPQINQILCLGEAPTRWTRVRHFPPPLEPTHKSIPTCCGPWHSGEGHFFTFYTCESCAISSLTPLRRTFLNLPACSLGFIELSANSLPPGIYRLRHSRFIEVSLG